MALNIITNKHDAKWAGEWRNRTNHRPIQVDGKWSTGALESAHLARNMIAMIDSAYPIHWFLSLSLSLSPAIVLPLPLPLNGTIQSTIGADWLSRSPIFDHSTFPSYSNEFSFPIFPTNKDPIYMMIILKNNTTFNWFKRIVINLTLLAQIYFPIKKTKLWMKCY